MCGWVVHDALTMARATSSVSVAGSGVRAITTDCRTLAVDVVVLAHSMIASPMATSSRRGVPGINAMSSDAPLIFSAQGAVVSMTSCAVPAGDAVPAAVIWGRREAGAGRVCADVARACARRLSATSTARRCVEGSGMSGSSSSVRAPCGRGCESSRMRVAAMRRLVEGASCHDTGSPPSAEMRSVTVQRAHP